MSKSGNMDDLGRPPADEVAFRSSVARTSYPGCTTTTLVFRTVNIVFEDLKCHHNFVTGNGASMVLEFSVNMSSKVLRNIGMVRSDAKGRTVEFEVMVRPTISLQAFGTATGAKLGDKIALLKAEA